MKPDFRNREFAVVQKGLAARKHDTRLAALAPSLPLPRKIDELAAEARRQFDQHDFSSAKKLCKDVLSRAPSHVDSLNLLGLIAQESGRHSKAIRFFNKAISADPYDGVYHYNIGSSYEALNDWDKAAVHFKEAINLGLDKNNDLGETERLLVQRAEVAACIERMRAAWPRRLSAAELFGEEGVAAVAGDYFLCCALETTKLDGLLVEVFLTEVRRALLQVATNAAPDFGETDISIVRLSFALAQQFFMNEYVYSQSTEEDRQVAALRDVLQEKLRIGTKVAPFLLAIIAAYVPLHTLPNLETLQQTQWPNVLVGLIRQQIIEVKERYGKAASLVIEDGGISYGLIQSLREKHINVVDYKPKGDKQERLISQIDLFQGGSVLLPKDAPWLEAFVAEPLSFPGRHDDQVDALAQGLAWRREAWRGPLVQRRTTGHGG